jgi:hypothetical protein
MTDLYIDVRKAYDSVRREVLYKVLMEFGYHSETGKANKIVVMKLIAGRQT